MPKHLIDKINEILPQTQCTRCSYPNCKEYATAIADNAADINQCPPGGDLVIKQLATLLNKPVKALNPENGTIKPRQIAIIKEEDCIGCTLCIKACPVDAIVGTNKMMHTVIEDYCTGCDLCVPVCPVDCIIMEDAQDSSWSKAQAQASKHRYENHNLRKQIELKEREARLKKIRENKN
jgi:electron transport complex protein RnfB